MKHHYFKVPQPPPMQRCRFLCVFIACVVGSSCDFGDDMSRDSALKAAKSQLKKQNEKKKKKKKDSIKVGQTVQTPTSYSTIGMRDPFESYLDTYLNLRRGGFAGPASATERFELSEYVLTGIVSGTTKPRAIVKDPSGEGHIIKLGSRLGLSRGRVTRISNREVVVREEHPTPTGDRTTLTRRLKLPSAEKSSLANPTSNRDRRN